MNTVTGLNDAHPSSIEPALREAIPSEADGDTSPLRVCVDGVEYQVEAGRIFTVAGLSEREKSALRDSLDSQAEDGLVFIDDPYAGLGDGARHRLTRFLRSLHDDRQSTIVLATDDCKEALALGDQVVITRGTTLDRG